ncbi:hypothetical protein [Anaeromyxobacter sp. PSR-1]|uniref:hypothetical protein n=1 Tax=Anaeromyxobacter sp. PSR-1 TaxID=1300915 RepID=UPI0005E6E7A7|nr:hypothetical protein [Anaeromyxobacter sp. PSR-1]GAO05040.1 hypothetical protein PSR1_03945 [Anaeromyxobacter sp. PSR-1]
MSTPTSTPLPVPPLESILLQPRRAALDAFARSGWRPYATPISLDAERRRLLNIDLTEPEMAFHDAEGGLAAVANVETDREGRVTHVEVVGAEPADPVRVALALLGEVGPPRTGGGGEAREWIWGPESGAALEVGGEPVRVWMCAERAYGDRLWLVASVVRRG